MESMSTTVPSAKKTIRKSSLIILLAPAIIGVLIWNIGHFAYRHGIFYMPPSFITGSTLVFFAVICIYLRFRLVKPRIAFFFILITGIILLLNLFIHTSSETAKYEPVLNLSKTFKVPSGWIEAGESSPYGFFGNLWKKDDVKSPITAEDLEKIASENNIKNYQIIGNCDIDVSGCALFGDINGRNVELDYFGSSYTGPESRLTLYIRDIYPPMGYKLMPYCSEMDLAGDMMIEQTCSPLDIFKHNFF